MKIRYVWVLLALSACDSKPAFEGVCIEKGDAKNGVLHRAKAAK